MTQAAWTREYTNESLRWTRRTMVGAKREIVTMWFGVAKKPGDPLFETVLYRYHALEGHLRGARGSRIDLLAEYATRSDASAGHDRWVAAARVGPLPCEVEGGTNDTESACSNDVEAS